MLRKILPQEILRGLLKPVLLASVVVSPDVLAISGTVDVGDTVVLPNRSASSGAIFNYGTIQQAGSFYLYNDDVFTNYGLHSIDVLNIGGVAGAGHYINYGQVLPGSGNSLYINAGSFHNAGTVQAFLWNRGTVDNFGVINLERDSGNYSVLNNYSDIVGAFNFDNYQGAQLTNNGLLTTDRYIENSGTLVNNGTVSTWDWESWQGSFTYNNGIFVGKAPIANYQVDPGQIANRGYWENTGEIYAGQGVTNFGDFLNKGLIEAGTFRNYTGYTFTNASGGELLLYNNNQIKAANEGILVNSGTLRIQSLLVNSGVLVNNGVLDNTGTLENAATGDLQFADNSNLGGTIKNDGLVSAGGNDVTFIGMLKGAGTVVANNVIITGEIQIADDDIYYADVAQMDIVGNMLLGDFASMAFTIEGEQRGISYDALDITGDILLDGTLEITFDPNIVISSSGYVFDLIFANSIVGSFDTVLFSNLSSEWRAAISVFSATGNTQSLRLSISQVPIPAASWLFSSALLALVGVVRKKQV